MKKVLSMLLVLCMVLGMSVSAFAAESRSVGAILYTSGSIYVQSSWKAEDKDKEYTFALCHDDEVLVTATLNNENYNKLNPDAQDTEVGTTFRFGNCVDDYWTYSDAAWTPIAGKEPNRIAILVDGEEVGSSAKFALNGGDGSTVTGDNWASVSASVDKIAFVNEDGTESWIYFEMKNIDPTKLQITLRDAENNRMATTTYQKESQLFSKITARIMIEGDSSSWKTGWVSAPSNDQVPTTILVEYNGELLGTVKVSAGKADFEEDMTENIWGDVDGVKEAKEVTAVLPSKEFAYTGEDLSMAIVNSVRFEDENGVELVMVGGSVTATIEDENGKAPVEVGTYTITATFRFSVDGQPYVAELNDTIEIIEAPVKEEPFVPVAKEETYKSVIAATSNGSVKVDSKKATRGEKVTITVTPDKGYELAALSVIDEDGNERKVTENENGTFSFRMPEGGVTIEAEFAKIGASTSAPSTEKENPSTGASDFVGAAAALAVVSVMGMAALSLKK